jgi:hypothetical protein
MVVNNVKSIFIVASVACMLFINFLGMLWHSGNVLNELQHHVFKQKDLRSATLLSPQRSAQPRYHIHFKI